MTTEISIAQKDDLINHLENLSDDNLAEIAFLVWLEQQERSKLRYELSLMEAELVAMVG